MDYYQVGRWAVGAVSTGASTCLAVPSTTLRDHLRMSTTTGEDDLLRDKVAAAQRRIIGRTLRPLFREQFDLQIDRFPEDDSPIRLPRMPVISVDAVWSYDTEGSSSQFGSSGYFTDTISEPARLCLKSGYTWPSGLRDQAAGLIRFTAGYSSSTSDGPTGIPDPLVEAVKKLATELYENREGLSIGNSVNEPLPFGIEEMLSEFVSVEVG